MENLREPFQSEALSYLERLVLHENFQHFIIASQLCSLSGQTWGACAVPAKTFT